MGAVVNLTLKNENERMNYIFRNEEFELQRRSGQNEEPLLSVGIAVDDVNERKLLRDVMERHS